VKKNKYSLIFLSLFFILIFFINGLADAQSSAPDWTRDPYRRFERQTYIAAAGMGNSRQAAERDALAKLVAIFGQSIQVDERISTSYQEAVNSGSVAVWSENTAVENTITTSTGMDSLVGAEIGDRWDNGRDFYAIAILNKLNAISSYSQMIRANTVVINNLVNIPAAEKNTLESYARFQFAAIIADITISYANVLNFIGMPDRAHGLRTGNDFRLEAQEIARSIPVSIRVRNDKAQRIENVFARSFTEIGFRSGGSNSRYVLDVNIIITPLEFPRNPNKFVRMELTANLTDTNQGVVLLPYSYINNREGHATLEEAENRIFSAAEQKIRSEYTGILNEYLSSLIPQRR